MAPPVDVNYLAVLVSGIVAMVLGTLWYGPIFGKQWIKLMGISQQKIDEAKKKGMKGMLRHYAGNFITVLVLAYILSHFVDYAQASTAMDALQLAFWVWLGFVFTLMVSMNIWEGKPVKLLAINAGYRLVELIILSLMLTLWA